MTTLKDQVLADLKASMKARDAQRTATLRMLKAAIIYESVQGSKHELSEAEIVTLVKREIKKRRESAEIYAQAGRQELADNELAEAAILEEYLPEQLSDAEVAAIVDKHVAQLGEPATMKHMGRVMQAVKAEVGIAADGKRLSDAVRLRIQQ